MWKFFQWNFKRTALCILWKMHDVNNSTALERQKKWTDENIAATAACWQRRNFSSPSVLFHTTKKRALFYKSEIEMRKKLNKSRKLNKSEIARYLTTTVVVVAAVRVYCCLSKIANNKNFASHSNPVEYLNICFIYLESNIRPDIEAPSINYELYIFLCLLAWFFDFSFNSRLFLTYFSFFFFFYRSLPLL